MAGFTPRKFTFLSLSLLFALNASSQVKESWLRRTWHNMNARFNGLYLAKEDLNRSVESLRSGHKDDFNQIISVFPYGTAEQRKSQKAALEEVYKKCSNVIKKHPKSRWVDDAWFLIGESYLFQNELYTAIETYQYVANQFPDGEKKYDAKLGILMAYIAQEKYYDAEAIMSVLRKEGKFPSRLEQKFSAIAAEIYIKEEKYSQAIESLEKSLSLARKRDVKSRYHYILAQLYLKTDNIEKSKDNFIRTIKLNPPYELAFQSNLGLIKTIGLSGETSLKTPRKYLKKMLNDDKNIDYYDQIYYELANLELQAGNIEEAVRYYQKSAQTSVKNKDQKANSYLALAELFFEQKNFELSQKYFDSTAMFVSETRPDYENIKAKQLVLTDLIENLISLSFQDSVLELSKLDRGVLDNKLKQQYEFERRQAELKKEQEELNQPLIDYNDPFNTPSKITQNPMAGGVWYFYNPTAMARGQNDFKRQWGNRPKTDLWRYKSLQSQLNKVVDNNDDPDKGDETQEDEDIVYDQSQDEESQEILKDVKKELKKYYKNIPFSDEAKRAANKKIAEALFGAGKIYYEDLKEYDKAKNYFNRLFKRYPGDENEAEALFYMYKMAETIEDKSDMKKYAELLDSKHNDSPYNMVLNRQNDVDQIEGSNEVVVLYNKAYDAFQAGDYDKALKYRTEAMEEYAGNSLQSKFDYLNALITGKREGRIAYVEALQKIVDLYPGTAVAKHADYTIQLLREQEEEDEEDETRSKFLFDPGADHYFIAIYDGGNSGDILASFSDYNRANHNSAGLKTKSYIVGAKNVVAIQSFKDKDIAEEYYVEFIKNDKFFKELDIRAYDLYTISQANFRILLMEKDADDYARFFIQNYIQ